MSVKKIGVDAKIDFAYAARMGKKKHLSKDDPEFYSKIAAMAGKKLVREHGTNYFSELAKKSHPRAEYHGGRPKKAPDASAQPTRKKP